MVLDLRIKRISKGCFRPKLGFEDCVDGEGLLVDVYSSNESLSCDGVKFSEKAFVFLDKPIVVPNMNYLYATKLRNIDDGILERLVCDLMFLNPNIDDRGISKMCSWIVSYFVYSDKDGEKSVKYEELLPVVSRICGEYIDGDVDIVESNKVILYKINSLLLKADKIWYSNHYRSKRISMLTGEIIHEGAILASENVHYMLKLSRPRVLEYTKKIRTLGTLNKYMEQRTIRLLEDQNSKRVFSTEGMLEKFMEFISIYDSGKSLDHYTEKLSMSKTTAVEFKRLVESK